MTKRFSVLTVENFLYLVFFGLAVTLRLYHLGAYPLASAEAREALIAFQWMRGLPALGLPHSPAYFFFTSLGFFLFGAGDLVARLAPALAGASLALLPALFRDKLGRPQAALTGGLLALSAGMLAASRTADGTLLALAGLGWGIGVFHRYLRDNALPTLMLSAGLFGLGLASGGAFLTGLCPCLLAALGVAWLNPQHRPTLRLVWTRVRAQGAVFFGTLAVSALLMATAGLAYLPGLGALAGSWRDWLVGFAPSGAGRAPGLFLLFLLAYEPLIVVFGIIGAVFAFRPRGSQGQAEAEASEVIQSPAGPSAGLRQWLAWLALLALLLCLLYGGRTLPMVVWVIAPLAGLAACAVVEIVRTLWVPAEWPHMLVQVALVLALLVFGAIRLTEFVSEGGSVSAAPAGFSAMNANLSLAGIALLMAVGISLLFGAGWSWKSAAVGGALSAAVALLAVSFGAGWSLTQTQPTSPAELWWEAPTADAVTRLVQTARRVSSSRVGSDYDAPLTVQADAAGAPGWVLRWAFRDFTHVTFLAALDSQVNSTLVVAPATAENPTLGAAYAGQAFAFTRSWSPASLSATDWAAWALYRRAPIQTDKLILWERQDVAGSTP